MDLNEVTIFTDLLVEADKEQRRVNSIPEPWDETTWNQWQYNQGKLDVLHEFWRKLGYGKIADYIQKKKEEGGK